MKSNQFIGLLLTILIFISCKDQSFIKTKNATVEIHSIIVSPPNTTSISSYTLTYNPKGNGFIKLQLESKAEYEAKSVEGGSFSSIFSLLKETNAVFDTLRKELVVIKPLKY